MELEKKAYVNPEMEIILLEAESVIMSSAFGGVEDVEDLFP